MINWIDFKDPLPRSERSLLREIASLPPVLPNENWIERIEREALETPELVALALKRELVERSLMWELDAC